jgi:hypothetical protein
MADHGLDAASWSGVARILPALSPRATDHFLRDVLMSAVRRVGCGGGTLTTCRILGRERVDTSPILNRLDASSRLTVFPAGRIRDEDRRAALRFGVVRRDDVLVANQALSGA